MDNTITKPTLDELRAAVILAAQCIDVFDEVNGVAYVTLGSVQDVQNTLDALAKAENGAGA